MRIIQLILAFMTVSLQSLAQDTVQLWPHGAPGNNGEDNTAELTIYRPATSANTAKAVIICPGGGYAKRAMDHEGHRIASWLSRQGITGVVLKYRLPHGHHDIPGSDAREAIRYIRSNAGTLGINPSKIGIMGSSAGGHLAATAATMPVNPECRPDFAILLYPVISTDPDIAHKGSVANLLGSDKDNADLLRKYSVDRQVDSKTPPTIMLLSDDDRGVSPLNSIRYYSALKANGIPASIHIFPEGGHGWGFNTDFAYLTSVKELIADWIARQ